MKKKQYYILYSLLFVILFFLCFCIFFIAYKKSILRKADTFDMHYLEFLYLGRWVRNALMHFQFPVWDHSIGYGADFFLTMSGFICDPLNWISVILPEKLAEGGFFLMVACKLYLTGISFSILGFRRNLEPYAVLCGALIYTFSACAYTGLYQSGFINPMYTLPLLICGVDNLFEGNRSLLYVLVLVYCAITSFYLTYMIAILIVLYCILKWIFREKGTKTRKAFGRIFTRLVVYSLWAACIAAIVLVPMALLMLDMDRLDLQRFIPPLYDKNFYSNMYRGFIEVYDMQGRDCKIGFSVLALICIFILFTSEKEKNWQQKVEFILMSIGLCIPMVGHLMNGFGYVANRWIWAYALLIAYIVAIELPTLKTLDASHWIRVVFLVCIYIFLAYEIFNASSRAFLTLSISILLLCVICRCFLQLSQKSYERIIIVITCISVFLPSFYYYSKNYKNYFKNNIEAGSALSLAENSGGLPLLNKIDTSDGTRYNRNGLSPVRNASWLYGVGGMDFYMNMYNNSIDQFHNSLAVDTYPWSFGYDGLDMRSELLAIMGVNHFFTPNDLKAKPIGFNELEAEGIGKEGNIQSWKPMRNYGLFTRFTSSVDYDVYEDLSPYDKQKQMMVSVVTDVGNSSSIERDKYVLDSYIETMHDLQYTGNHITVKKSGAQLVLRFPEQKNSEIYIHFDNIWYENGLSDSYVISAFALLDNDPVESSENSYRGLTNIHHMYGGKHNWMLNLGAVKEEINGVCITFDSPGQYVMDGLYLYSDTVENIENNIANLNQDVERIHLESNRVSLTVNSDKEEYLFAAIPYSDGWEAYDNGKPVEILQADVAFMALKLDEGSHEISFVYHTPGLLAGFVISLVSLAGYIVYQKRLKRRAGVLA